MIHASSLFHFIKNLDRILLCYKKLQLYAKLKHQSITCFPDLIHVLSLFLLLLHSLHLHA
jgi:hypothetical protein